MSRGGDLQRFDHLAQRRHGHWCRVPLELAEERQQGRRWILRRIAAGERHLWWSSEVPLDSQRGPARLRPRRVTYEPGGAAPLKAVVLESCPMGGRALAVGVDYAVVAQGVPISTAQVLARCATGRTCKTKQLVVTRAAQ